MTNADSLINEMLLQWQESRASGHPQTPDELCASHPELLPQLRERLQALMQIEAFLGLEEGPPETASANAVALASTVDAALEQTLPVELLHHPRYEVTGFIGSGGMGHVFQARHKLMGRTVALKIIRPQLLQRPDIVERFQREVKAAAQLNHPNIAHAYDAEQIGSTHYLVLEAVVGEGLDTLLRHGERFTVERACALARDVASGLQHAHEHGIIHRDIKPGNIVVSTNGQAKILDFGLARLSAAQVSDAIRTELSDGPTPTSATHTGQVMGTPDYMPPEQAHGSATIDARADQYALGCTLYHLLTGQAPFPGGTILEKIRRHQTEQPPAPSALNPDVSPALDAVVAQLMAKEPTERFATAHDVTAALAPWVEEPTPHRYRRWLLASVGSVLVMTVLVGMLMRPSQGTLVILSDDAEAVILVTDERQMTQELKTGPRHEHRLPPGRYELALASANGAVLDTPSIDVTRGGVVVVRVLREKPDTLPTDIELFPVQSFAFRVPTTKELFRQPVPLDTLRVADMPAHTWRHLTALNLRVDINFTAPFPHLKRPATRPTEPVPELLRVFGLPEETPFRTLRASSRPAFSPDGEWLAVACDDLQLVKRHTGTVQQRWPIAKDDLIGCCEWSADGRWLATASVNGKITLYDMTTKKVLASVQFPNTQFWALTFGPQSKTLFASAIGAAPDIFQLSVPQLQAVAPAKSSPDSTATGIAVHPSGAFFAVGTENGVQIYDATKHALLHTLDGMKFSGHHNVAFSPDGQWLAAGTDHETNLWKVDKPETMPTHEHRWKFPGAGLLKFSNDSRVLWFSRTDHNHDLNDRQVTFRQAILATKEVQQEHSMIMLARWGMFQLSPDETTIGGAYGSPKTVLQLYDVKQGQWTHDPRGSRHARAVKTLAFSPDGRYLVSGGEDNMTKVWNLTTGELAGHLPRRGGWVHGLAFDPKSGHVAVSAGDSQVQMWQWPRQRGATITLPSFGEEITFTPDGAYLLAGDANATVSVIDPRTPQLLGSFTKQQGHLWSIACDRTGTKFATAADDGTVSIWNLRTMKEEQRVLCRHSAPDGSGVATYRVRCLPDNRGFATTGRDGVVRLWSWQSGAMLAEYPVIAGLALGLSVRPDGKAIAVCGHKGTVKVLDLTVNPSKLIDLTIPCFSTDPCVEFSPEGRHLAVGGHDGSVRVYRLAERVP